MIRHHAYGHCTTSTQYLFIYDGDSPKMCRLQLCVMLSYGSKSILNCNWRQNFTCWMGTIIRTNYNGQTHYDWLQDVGVVNLPICRIIPSVYPVLTPQTRTCKWWRSYSCRACSIRDRYFTRRRKATDAKTNLDTIIHRSAHLIDHCQRRADEHDPQQRTVQTHNKNGKPRLVLIKDF